MRRSESGISHRTLFSTLWIFVLFQYVYGDILILVVNPASYHNATEKMSGGTMLGLTLLMEIPMAMIVLSRLLRYRANRIANIIAGLVSTAFVMATVIGGKLPPAYFLLLSFIEVVCTLFITWYAWTWKERN